MRVFLFDMDGTLAQSGQKLCPEMTNLLVRLRGPDAHVGIVGGGSYDKIIHQIGELEVDHIFSECGTVYHHNNHQLIYEKNIRHHLFPHIRHLIRIALGYLSPVEYNIAGHLIDLRRGLVYISLVGMQATIEERTDFITKHGSHRNELLSILREYCIAHHLTDHLQILEGGEVGLSNLPKEWDKIQVLQTILRLGYTEIHYFGDKFQPDGNDYLLLNDPNVCGHPVLSVADTMEQLRQHINKD